MATKTYQLVDILKHAQDYQHGCSVHNLLNVAQPHFRGYTNFSSSQNYNLASPLTGRKELFAIAFLVCGTLRGDFETIPMHEKINKNVAQKKILFETMTSKKNSILISSLSFTTQLVNLLLQSFVYLGNYRKMK